MWSDSKTGKRGSGKNKGKSGLKKIWCFKQSHGLFIPVMFHYLGLETHQTADISRSFSFYEWERNKAQRCWKLERTSVFVLRDEVFHPWITLSLTFTRYASLLIEEEEVREGGKNETSRWQSGVKLWGVSIHYMPHFIRAHIVYHYRRCIVWWNKGLFLFLFHFNNQICIALVVLIFASLQCCHIIKALCTGCFCITQQRGDSRYKLICVTIHIEILLEYSRRVNSTQILLLKKVMIEVRTMLPGTQWHVRIWLTIQLSWCIVTPLVKLKQRLTVTFLFTKKQLDTHIQQASTTGESTTGCKRNTLDNTWKWRHEGFFNELRKAAHSFKNALRRKVKRELLLWSNLRSSSDTHTHKMLSAFLK